MLDVVATRHRPIRPQSEPDREPRQRHERGEAFELGLAADPEHHDEPDLRRTSTRKARAIAASSPPRGCSLEFAMDIPHAGCIRRRPLPGRPPPE